jgi:hypothetical protein
LVEGVYLVVHYVRVVKVFVYILFVGVLGAPGFDPVAAYVCVGFGFRVALDLLVLLGRADFFFLDSLGLDFADRVERQLTAAEWHFGHL